MGVDGVAQIVWRFAVFADAVDEVADHGREGMVIDIAGVFAAGVDGEIVCLAGETAQVETVVHDGAFFAQDVDVRGVGIAADQRAGEDAEGAIAEADLRGFYRRILVVIADHGGIAAYLADIGADDVAGHVHGMAAGEDEGAAAVVAVFHPAGAFAAKPVIDIGHEDPPEFALLNESALHGDQRFEAQNEAHHGFYASALDRRDHGREVLFADGDGLFDEDVLAGLGRHDALLRVLVVGRADGNDVHPFVSQQRGEVGVGGSRNAEFLLFGLNAAVGTAAEGDDLAGRMAQIGVDVAAGDPAATPYRTTVFALSHCCTS